MLPPNTSLSRQKPWLISGRQQGKMGWKLCDAGVSFRSGCKSSPGRRMRSHASWPAATHPALRQRLTPSWPRSPCSAWRQWWKACTGACWSTTSMRSRTPSCHWRRAAPCSTLLWSTTSCSGRRAWTPRWSWPGAGRRLSCPSGAQPPWQMWSQTCRSLSASTWHWLRSIPSWLLCNQGSSHDSMWNGHGRISPQLPALWDKGLQQALSK